MKFVAGQIQAEVGQVDGLLILTSTAPRAQQSAEVLARILNAPSEEHPVLWSDSQHRENFGAVLALIQERQESKETLVLVTHLEYGERFPRFFGEKELGVAWGVMRPHYAEGCFIDVEAKTVRPLTQPS